MIDIIPARPEMISLLDVQSAQKLTGMELNEVSLGIAIRSGLSLAAVHNGQILGVGGVAEQWPGRGIVWGLLSKGIGVKMAPVHKAVMRALEICPMNRVEAYVLNSHKAGHRWMKMLGFKKEGVMKKYWQDHDFAVYARVKD